METGSTSGLGIGFRIKFREQNGFCNFHSYKFLKYNDSLAVSLTHKDLLFQKIKQYKKKSYKKTGKNKQKNCLICDKAKDAEQRYISEMIEYLNDSEFKNKFIGSEGLCIPHFEFLLQRNKKIPDWFIRYNKLKYKKLLDDINKYTEACNASLGDIRPALSKDEANSWRKIIGILSGFEGMLPI